MRHAESARSAVRLQLYSARTRLATFSPCSASRCGLRAASRSAASTVSMRALGIMVPKRSSLTSLVGAADGGDDCGVAHAAASSRVVAKPSDREGSAIASACDMSAAKSCLPSRPTRWTLLHPIRSMSPCLGPAPAMIRCTARPFASGCSAIAAVAWASSTTPFFGNEAPRKGDHEGVCGNAQLGTEVPRARLRHIRIGIDRVGKFAR